MNKKVVKIMTTLLLIMMIVSISISAFADSTKITPGGLKAGDVDTSQIKDVGQKLIGILQAVGIVLSVVVLIVLGIKYMIGSAEEKAEYKKTMLPYIIGAALIFAASSLAQVVYQFFS